MSSSVDQLFNDVTFSEDESLSASCENLLDENGKVKGLKEENGSVALSDASGNGVVKKKKKNIFSGFKIKSKTPKDTTKK